MDSLIAILSLTITFLLFISSINNQNEARAHFDFISITIAFTTLVNEKN